MTTVQQRFGLTGNQLKIGTENSGILVKHEGSSFEIFLYHITEKYR